MSGHLRVEEKLETILHNIDYTRLNEKSDGADSKQSTFLTQILEPVRLINPNVTFEETLNRILNAAILIAQCDMGFVSLRTIKNRLEFKMGRNKIGQKKVLEEFYIVRDLINKSIHAESITFEKFSNLQNNYTCYHILIGISEPGSGEPPGE